jgi:hypothetical protein
MSEILLPHGGRAIVRQMLIEPDGVLGPAHDDPERIILFQFFHLCRQIGISAYSVGGILARQNPDIVIRL